MFTQFPLLLWNKWSNIVKDNTNCTIISVCFSLITNTVVSQKKLFFTRNPWEKLTHPLTAEAVVAWPIRMLASQSLRSCTTCHEHDRSCVEGVGVGDIHTKPREERLTDGKPKDTMTLQEPSLKPTEGQIQHSALVLPLRPWDKQVARHTLTSTPKVREASVDDECMAACCG